jgi:hypothetical protein
MSDLELLKHQPNPRFTLGPADTPQGKSKADIMADGASQEQRFLKHSRDPTMIGKRSQVLPEHPAAHHDRAGGEWQQTRERQQERALAGTVWTIDADGFANSHREIGRLERESPIAVNTNS